ncbi:unnamed protein product [Sordaria macrospora k-hell]|uniref:WGS project CABT00000000 data, contig 2.50 n=1 Tax=Sordaria macrospora (strain ATCC MYA-333 / DSM 997 / K(L3346) / K-hell) TaxID=771870 RepID=F7W994_SORMK|nr:uncharacterized protein SMAC_08041 [Sordaria macrospora k-hell]CCC05174.1 unnamed protein product [Sordaria macrospora k-hell]
MAAVAPMDMDMEETKYDPTSIPLKCTICPKQPVFSDVSHLLTHCSSKSHLSYRFKTELRSGKDDESRETLQQYLRWEETSGIKGLLLNGLKQRKTKDRQSVAGRPAQNKPKAFQNRDDLVKNEPVGEQLDRTPVLTHWITDPNNASLQFHNLRHGHGYLDPPGFQTPVMKRMRSDFSALDTPDNNMQEFAGKYARWPSETATSDSILPSSEVTSEITEFDDDDDESSKLKGIRYPGMGLFDSANEQQKRKRNQRKDESVLKLMEEASTTIERNEVIYNGDWTLQRERDVYASPSIYEGSPDRELEEADNHKKKRNRRASTLANAKPRATRSSARTKTVAKTKSTREDTMSIDQDEGISQVSGHSHGGMESYDVFHDPPQRSPHHNGSPMGSFFELRHRPALKALSSNGPLPSNGQLGSSGPKNLNGPQLSYFSQRDNMANSYSGLPSNGLSNSGLPSGLPSNGFFSSQQHPNYSGLNPLSISGRPSYMQSFNYSGYGGESPRAPNTSAFQPINQMVRSMSTAMPYSSSYASPYPADPNLERPASDCDV